MAKKRAGNNGGVNKSRAIKDALAQNPNALPKQLAAELNAQGLDVSPAYVSTIKTNMKTKSKGKRGGRRAVASGTGSSVQSASANGVEMLDVDSLLRAKSLVEQVGGVEKAQQLLAVLKKLQ